MNNRLCPFLLFSLPRPVDREQLERLRTLYGTPRRRSGEPHPPEFLARQAQRLASGESTSFGVVHPEPLYPRTTTHDLQSFQFSLALPVAYTKEDSDRDWPLPVFQREGPHLLVRPYCTDTFDFGLGRQREVDLFLDLLHKASPLVGPSWGVGGAFSETLDTTLRHPFQRAWGLMYFGPELVRRLGEDRVRSCPGYRIEEDARGGFWVQLEEHPFLDTEALRVRREEAALHLGLPDSLADL